MGGGELEGTSNVVCLTEACIDAAMDRAAIDVSCYGASQQWLVLTFMPLVLNDFPYAFLCSTGIIPVR